MDVCTTEIASLAAIYKGWLKFILLSLTMSSYLNVHIFCMYMCIHYSVPCDGESLTKLQLEERSEFEAPKPQSGTGRLVLHLIIRLLHLFISLEKTTGSMHTSKS